MTAAITTVVDFGVIGLLITWLGLSIAGGAGAPAVTSLISRLGRIHLLGDWSMFSAGSGALVGARFWFEYREFRADGSLATDWTAFADTSTPWTWYSFFWDPQRRLADRLRIVAREIRQAHAMEPPAHAALRRLTGCLADRLERIHPAPASGHRQIRLGIESWDARGAIPAKVRFIELEPAAAGSIAVRGRL